MDRIGENKKWFIKFDRLKATINVNGNNVVVSVNSHTKIIQRMNEWIVESLTLVSNYESFLSSAIHVCWLNYTNAKRFIRNALRQKSVKKRWNRKRKQNVPMPMLCFSFRTFIFILSVFSFIFLLFTRVAFCIDYMVWFQQQRQQQCFHCIFHLKKKMHWMCVISLFLFFFFLFLETWIFKCKAECICPIHTTASLVACVIFLFCISFILNVHFVCYVIILDSYLILFIILVCQNGSGRFGFLVFVFRFSFWF